jgi:O-antigen/teichoic acid export membrane protein
LGTPFALIRALTGKFMIIDGYNRPFLIRAVVLLLVNSLLCYLLMNQFGLIGLAIANMITIIFSGLFIDLIHQDTIQFFKIKCACVLNLKKPLQLFQEIKRLR